MYTIPEILSRLLDWVIWPLFFALSIIMFIYSGVLFLTAAGDPGKISAAKKALLWAIVGIAVAIAGFSAENIIRNILGVGGPI